MAYRSWTMLKRRFYRNGYALTDMTDSTREALGEHQIEMQQAESYTLGPEELPGRTDQDPGALSPAAAEPGKSRHPDGHLVGANPQGGCQAAAD